MKVIFTAGGSDYTLADGPDRGVNLHVGPAGFDHSSDGTVEMQSFLRRSTQTPVSRQNMATTVTFTVECERADLGSALAYSLDYPKAIPRNVAGALKCQEIVGGAPTVRQLTNAVCRRVRCRTSGVRVFISYDFIGSEFTT